MISRIKEKRYRKPKILSYFITRTVAWFVSHFVFHVKVLRNEIKGKKGAFTVIANHECAIDFVNLIGLSRRRMTFVVSKSFYSTLAVRRIMDNIGVIPKQQFQTEIEDIKKMKAVVENGAPLVIYPAGIMCEDGRSTPIPKGTWSLFQLLDTDVYMARTTGTYHVMPKWSKKLRPGRTYMDVYRLFTREELKSLSKEEIRVRAEEALTFDAYDDQEKYKIPYKGGDNVEGLDKVLFMCPSCHKKYSIQASGNTLSCSSCGFTASSDRYGFLTGSENRVRHVSKWNTEILKSIEEELTGRDSFSLPCDIYMVDEKHHKFVKTGKGDAVLTESRLSLDGINNGEPLNISKSINDYPCLPFSPGRYFEVQSGPTIYRCYPNEGKYVTEFIDVLKIWHAKSKDRIKAGKKGSSDLSQNSP